MTDDLLEEASVPLPEGYQSMNWFRGFGRQIGPLYERIGTDGTYTRAFLVQEHHTNGMGNCHGGMLMAFADMAFGHAITMATHRYWVTVRLLTDFLSSAKVGEWVEGNAEIVTGTGHTIARTTKVFLCRCGHSANKPFCDGSHKRVGFVG